MKTTTIWIVLLAVFVSACGSSAAEADPVAVLQAYEVAWNAQDLEALMALYAEDVVEFDGSDTFEGKAALRDFYDRFGILYGVKIACSDYQVDGNKVTYKCAVTFIRGGGKTAALYEAVIEDGLIVRRTYLREAMP
jgi:ketosteroid isomerase-like protein